MTRIRTQYIGSSDSGGRYYYTNNPNPLAPPVIVEQGTVGPQYMSKCTDLFGFHDQVFTVERTSLSGNVVNGASRRLSSGGADCIISNWRFLSVPYGLAHLYDPALLSNPAYAIQVLDRTNPSRPLIDLPVSIFELRELPDLLRGAGESAFKRPAHANLSWQFGVLPVVNDLKKLLSFNEKVENRVKLLKKLSQGTMTRKVSLDNSTVSALGGSGTVQSVPFTIRAKCTGFSTNRKIWGYVSYTPQPTFDKLVRDDSALRAKARQIILGLTLDSSTAWQALPWSWLADWFSDIGDYLQAHRNLVPLTIGTPRICTTTTTHLTYQFGVPRLQPNNINGYECGSYTITRTTKQRALASASLPTAHLPLLTGRQIGILSSLAVLRGG